MTHLWSVPVGEVVVDTLLEVAGLCTTHPEHQVPVGHSPFKVRREQGSNFKL